MNAVRPSKQSRRLRFALIGVAFLLMMLAEELRLPQPVRIAGVVLCTVFIVAEFLHD